MQDHSHLQTETDHDVFTTHTTMKTSVSLDELSQYLTANKVTGEIRVMFSQGGRRQVLVTEHTKLKATERDEVRKILGMEQSS